MADGKRGRCACCGKECAITGDGVIRFHVVPDDRPDCKEGPDSRKCKGAGRFPAGYKAPVVEPGTAGYVCRVCGHPVELTANKRARSHLDPRTNPPVRCDGGSDWPLHVDSAGARTDTRPADKDPGGFSMGHTVPDGDGHVTHDGAEAACTDPHCVPVWHNPQHRTTAYEDGSVRVGQDRPVVPGGHIYTDRTGIEWVHPGNVADCPTDECTQARCTHPQGFVYGDDDNGHSGDVCTVCGAEPCGAVDPADLDACGNCPDCTPERFMPQAQVPAACPGCGHPLHTGLCSDCDCLDDREDPRDALAADTFPIGAEHDPDTGVPADVLAATALGNRCALTGPGCQGDVEFARTPTHRRGAYLCTVHRAAQAGDGRTAAQQAEIDRRMADPLGHALAQVQQATASDAVARMRSTGKVAQLAEGVFFKRHTAKEPISTLVFRCAGPDPSGWRATVVTPGPYAGRDGVLTNLEEVITWTDLDGRPRPRREAQPPSSPAPQTTGPAASSTPTTDPRSKPASAAPATPPSARKAAPSSRETSSAPTETTAGSTPSAPMTSNATQFLAGASGSHGEEEGRYDRYGRYILRHPQTGAEVNWTRATTFAKSISDTYALSMWSQRMVLKGATLRPDLVTMAHSKDVAEDKEWMDKATGELKNMAGDKVAANLGTAYHSFTELCDRAADPYAELVRVVPQEAQADIRAYLDLLAEVGLRPVPTLIEWSTGVLQYEVMGTSDRVYQVTKHLELAIPGKVVHLSPGEFVIGDVKTGKDLDYGWGEIAIQLAVYANGLNTLGRYDWGTQSWDPEPLAQYAEPGTKVRLDVGIVPHIPVDKSKGKPPALYAVDLESGWNAAVLCERVRSWRKYKKLAGPIRVLSAPAGPPVAPAAEPAPAAQAAPAATREPTLRELADAVTTRAEASAVFQKAKAAALEEKITADELHALVDHMQGRLRVLAEPGG